MKPKVLKNGSRKKVATPATTAPLETPAKSETTTTTATSHSAQPVTIEAKIDVGFGNALYVRGEGTGLSWNHGIPLTCVDSSTWKWSAEANDKLKFKLLLNDSVWAAGEDIVAAPGQKLQVCPTF
ncbi:MAG TPA: hypothetical protein VK327_06040 [Candidatus Paceibacterota bacterium]|nr:hypothetical protein [Candidatus Paceibacterota bacterium]